MVNVTLIVDSSLYQNSSFISRCQQRHHHLRFRRPGRQPRDGATQSLTATSPRTPGACTRPMPVRTEELPGNAKPSTFQGSTLSGLRPEPIAYSDGSFSRCTPTLEQRVGLPPFSFRSR